MIKGGIDRLIERWHPPELGCAVRRKRSSRKPIPPREVKVTASRLANTARLN